MYSQILPSVFLWIGIYLATKRTMDIQKDLCGWLEEATLFSPTKQQEHLENEDFLKLCFDEFIGTQKLKDNTTAAEDVFIDFPDVSDILVDDGWMDEKIDLSILDSSHDWLEEQNDTTKIIDGEPELVLGSYVDYIFSSSSDAAVEYEPVSPAGSTEEYQACGTDTNYASGVPTSPERVVPVEVGRQLPESPLVSSCSTSPVQSPSYFDASDSSVTTDLPVVYCVEVASDANIELNLLAKDSSVPFAGNNDFTAVWRKGSSNKTSKEASHVRKSLKAAACDAYQPYPKLKKECRRERKKVQNKEAAARYRVKKREQDRVLSDEVAALEAEQSELQDKHDKLKSEITYLKSLMREMFQARGILKKS